MRRLSFKLITAAACFIAGVAVFLLWGTLRFGGAGEVAPVYLPPGFSPAPTHIARPSLAPETTSTSEIRQVDFLNFTYPNLGYYYNRLRKTIELKQGEFEFTRHERDFMMWLVDLSPDHVSYADLTGDGEEEAILEMFSHSGMSGGEHFIYIYTMKMRHPRLLWFFETSASGSDIGGLRALKSQNGELELELNGVNRVIGQRATIGAEDCEQCDGYFTRLRFRWNGKTFQKIREPEILSRTDGRN